MIDAGVSFPVKILSINNLQKDPNFLSSCARSALKIKGYSEFEWSEAAVIEKTPQGWFFYRFLKRAGSKVALLGNLGALGSGDFDEICSIVLEKIADAVGEFSPVSDRDDGKTWGFEAYLQNYALKKAIKPCLSIWGSPIGNKKNKTSFVSINGNDLGWEQGNLSSLENSFPDLFSKADHSQGGVYSFDEKRCRNIIFCSVKEALREHPGAEAYFLHVVRGETIRETCKSLDISKSQCHRLVQEASEKVWANMKDAISVPSTV